MRVKITGEASTTKLLTDLGEPGEIESVEPEKDLNEQLFGIAEVATVVAIVKDAMDLAKMLVALARRVRPAEKSELRQKLYLKAPFGEVTIDLSAEATVEDLRRVVEPLFSVT